MIGWNDRGKSSGFAGRVERPSLRAAALSPSDFVARRSCSPLHSLAFVRGLDLRYRLLASLEAFRCDQGRERDAFLINLTLPITVTTPSATEF